MTLSDSMNVLMTWTERINKLEQICSLDIGGGTMVVVEVFFNILFSVLFHFPKVKTKIDNLLLASSYCCSRCCYWWWSPHPIYITEHSFLSLHKLVWNKQNAAIKNYPQLALIGPSGILSSLASQCLPHSWSASSRERFWKVSFILETFGGNTKQTDL